ncbi:MAG TPA: FtsX-like permease family protein, partial [Allosphingosinicella sp.]|nr:FtsX-like permease family protein [Allosphingosinicella sp.]
PWVIAIMMFLTVLAAATGIGLDRAANGLDGGNRVTIQIIEAEAAKRDGEAAAALAALRASPAVASVHRVPEGEMRRLLEPWLGPAGIEADIPIPALIEAELSPGADLAHIRPSLLRVAPSARIDANDEWLAPLKKLISALRWLAAALVLLMVGATAATVVLAARAALDTHRETIEVLHLMGATDRQVARLFQHRIALDALFGGIVGLGLAAVVLWLIGERVAALGSELVGSVGLSPMGWFVLGGLPVAGVILAMLVARVTILRALVRLL